MRSSPAKGWAKTGQMAPPLAESSPPGKEEQGRRESEGREETNLRPERLNGWRNLEPLSREREGCQ